MEDTKSKEGRLFWLKLEQTFFGQKEIKALRRIEGGDTYTLIYLKMMLASLADNGKLFFDGFGNSFADEMSLALDEDLDVVEATINFLSQYGLLAKSSDTEYQLTAVLGMTGSKSEAAVRKAKSRENQRQAMCDNVTNESQPCHATSQNVTQRREELEYREDSDSRSELRDNIREDPNKEPIAKEDSSSGYEPIEENSQNETATDALSVIKRKMKTDQQKTDNTPSGHIQNSDYDIRRNYSDVIDLFVSVTGISDRNYIQNILTDVFYDQEFEPNVVYIYMNDMLDYLGDVIQKNATYDNLGNRKLDIVKVVADKVKERYDEETSELPF